MGKVTYPPRRCSHCNNLLRPLKGSKGPASARERHCPSPTCDWCSTCYRLKVEECKVTGEL